MDYKNLALDIINNQAKYRVNREEKMERTIEVMTANMEKKAAQKRNKGEIETVENNRGYGEGRRMGD